MTSCSRRTVHRIALIVWTLGSIALAPHFALAQAATPAAKMGARYIPNDAIVVATGSPAELISNAAFAVFPIEIARAQAMDQVGIDPMKIALVKAIIGMPGPSGPQFGVVVEFNQDVEIAPLLKLFEVDPTTIQVGEFSAYRIQGQVEAVLHQLNARTLVLSSPGYLEPIIKADNGTGHLASLAANVPRTPGITVVAAIEPIRPMIGGLAVQQSQQLPPPLQPLGELPAHVEALLLNTMLNGSSTGARLTMLCSDDAAAEKVETILNDSLSFGREMGIAEVTKAMSRSQESKNVQDATLQYANRIANMVVDTLTPSRSGRRVAISVESTTGIAGAGVLVGLLLPAVQAAREAARRMSASNHIKQIVVAMHNYHESTRGLPPGAITDGNGKPLLSWRVAILPYVEQQALYEQFHLDEPWDSEHNLPLSKIMPEVYIDPSVQLEPGYTVLQAMVGESFALKSNSSTKFPEFTDGLSNTILVVEAHHDAAVPWSKPDDVQVDLDDPIASMGHMHVGGFHVGLADGSVRFITHSIDPQLFRAMLTRAGGESVQP